MKIVEQRKSFKNYWKRHSILRIVIETRLRLAIWWFFLKLACFSTLMRTVRRFVSLSAIHRHTFTAEKYKIHFIVCPGFSNLLIKQITGHEKSIKSQNILRKSIFLHSTTIQDHNKRGNYRFYGLIPKSMIRLFSEPEPQSGSVSPLESTQT